jgi:hypothetical protein
VVSIAVTLLQIAKTPLDHTAVHVMLVTMEMERSAPKVHINCIYIIKLDLLGKYFSSANDCQSKSSGFEHVQ